MNIDINRLLKNFIPYIIVFTISYMIATYLYVILPKTSVETTNSKVISLPYNKYNLSESFELREPVVVVVSKKVAPPPPPPPVIVEAPVVVVKEYFITDLVYLQAVYKIGKNGGLVVIAEKSNKATHMIKKGEQYDGYALEEIYDKYVIFTKNSIQYKLSLDNLDNSKELYTVPKVTTKPQVQTQKKIEKLMIKKTSTGYLVKRNQIKEYSRDPNVLWKGIGIKMKVKDGKSEGFEVFRVNQKSVFGELGIKQGDLIISVNNTKLKNYKDAMRFYNGIDKIDVLDMKVIRDGKEVDLEYEME